MLEITIKEESEGMVRASLKGRLDSETYAQCEERIRPFLALTTRVLVFDLEQLDYLSSMGLRVLMQATKSMASHGGKCLLTRPQAPVRAVIDIANAMPPETIFASFEEADHYLDAMQRRAKEKAAEKPPR